MSADLARLVLQALRAPGDEARALRQEFAAALASELKITAAPPPPVELLTLAQVAKMVGRTTRALQEAFQRGRKAGELHPLDQAVVMTDGVRRYPAARVREYIAAVTK